MLFLDVETFSSVDLNKAGTYAYAEAPDFEILMCAWSLDGGPVTVETDPEAIASIPGLADPGVAKVAHNASFERVCFSRWLGLPPGQYLPPEQWIDTMALAALAGLPRGLGKLAKAVGVAEKDTAGTRLINLFSKLRRGERTLPADRPDEWAQYLDYCRQDVETLVEVYRELPDWTDSEQQFYCMDQRINDRGMLADLALAGHCIEADRANRERAARELEDLLGIDNAASVPQLLKALAAAGAEMPNLRAETVSRKLSETDLAPRARRALELRQELALVAARKYEAVRHAAGADGRVRGQFRYFGAHTGRWSGRGVQLQNLPRASVPAWPAGASDQRSLDRGAEVAALDLRLGLGADPQTLKALIRSVFVGPLVVADYSAIEARVLAWVANEQWAIDAFAEGRDIYVETAQRMGGLTRQQGKVAVLALGYQGGANSLRHMGASGTDEELQAMKVQWRRANRAIVRLWADLNNAFGDGGQAGRLVVHRVGGDRHLQLPSGRSIVYRNVRWERWVVVDPETGAKRFKQGWRFDSEVGRADTYGGRLCISGDALVLTDRGWVELRDVLTTDLVWDGVEFVAQDGLVSKGVKPVINIEGVRMTPDHLIMQRGEWRVAKQYNRSDWQVVELPNCGGFLPLEATTRRNWSSPSLAGPVRVWNQSASPKGRGASGVAGEGAEVLRVSDEGVDLSSGHRGGGWAFQAPTLQPMANGEVPVYTANRPRLAQLRWAWDRYVRPMVARLLGLRRGHGPYVVTRSGVRPEGQRRPVLAGELSMGYNTEANSKPAQVHLDGISVGQNTAFRGVTAEWDRVHHTPVPVGEGSPRRTTVGDPERGEEVFDLMNCGPRNRFVVLTQRGPLLVHNCENAVQAISRDLLAHGMLNLERAGYRTVGHVHDEVIVEADPDQTDRIGELICQLPDWAQGLPLTAEGFACDRYRKG